MNSMTYTEDEVRRRVMEKIAETLQTAKEFDLDEDLAAHGMDSFMSMNLAVEFEAIFGIEYEDEELLFENFATARTMIERLLGKLELV